MCTCRYWNVNVLRDQKKELAQDKNLTEVKLTREVVLSESGKINTL